MVKPPTDLEEAFKAKMTVQCHYCGAGPFDIPSTMTAVCDRCR